MGLPPTTPHSRRRVLLDGLDVRLDLGSRNWNQRRYTRERTSPDSPASRFATIQGPSAAPILAVSAALEMTVASAWTRLFGTIVYGQRLRASLGGQLL
jgi:hypothetical protein